VARVLIIDDEEDIRTSLRMILSYEGYDVELAASGPAGLEAARATPCDLVFLDVKMPGMDGLEALEKLKAQGSAAPVVVISGHGTLQTAVQATKLGAYDFMEKPLERDRVLLVARNALEHRTLAAENRALKLRFEERYRLVGGSRAMKELEEAISRAAPTNSTVLVMGESGTGKELVAHAIHKNSKRAKEPFVQVNCAAIPEELIESELFGHEKGSFTGAIDRQTGKFVEANKGTIFLDEIADMSLKTQAKVLRVLQDGELQPVGSNKVTRVDVRVIAATNKNLADEMKTGRFREDLYYRLNVVPLRTPPLRERRDDIPLLIEHFARRLAEEQGLRLKAFAAEAMERLKRYGWPGNVRELKNTVERLLIMSGGPEITLRDLPEEIRSDVAAMLPDFRSYATLRDFKDATERSFLVEKLKENEWNISLTAQRIDTPRSNLYKKLEQYGISEKGDG